MAILTSPREKELRKLVPFLEHAIDDMIRDAPTENEKRLYRAYGKSIASTGVVFVDRKTLSSTGTSQLLGLHTDKIFYTGDPKNPKVGVTNLRRQSVIYLPAKHLFKGNKLTLEGVSTLVHEWAHFPKNIKRLARGLKLSHEAAEEFLADVLAAKVLKKTGRFNDAQILRTFRGRIGLFREYNPNFKYDTFMRRVITPKKEKIKVPKRRLPKRKPKKAVGYGRALPMARQRARSGLPRR